MTESPTPVKVAALYHFAVVDDPAVLRMQVLVVLAERVHLMRAIKDLEPGESRIFVLPVRTERRGWVTLERFGIRGCEAPDRGDAQHRALAHQTIESADRTEVPTPGASADQQVEQEYRQDQQPAESHAENQSAVQHGYRIDQLPGQGAGGQGGGQHGGENPIAGVAAETGAAPDAQLLAQLAHLVLTGGARHRAQGIVQQVDRLLRRFSTRLRITARTQPAGELITDTDPLATAAYFQDAQGRQDWKFDIANDEELQRTLSLVEQGLKEQIFAPPHPAYTELLLSSVPEMDPDWLTTVLEERGVDNIGEGADV